MLIIEKVFLLKSVDLFADISEERLIGIAEVIEEELVGYQRSGYFSQGRRRQQFIFD